MVMGKGHRAHSFAIRRGHYLIRFVRHPSFPYRQLCQASSSVPKPAVLENMAVIKVATASFRGLTA